MAYIHSNVSDGFFFNSFAKHLLVVHIPVYDLMKIELFGPLFGRCGL